MNLDFQDIFNELLNILPSGWENAIFMAEYTSGSYSMRCYSKEASNTYINVMKMKGISKTQIIKTYKALNNIFQKERMKLAESSWYAITLKFDKNGKLYSKNADISVKDTLYQIGDTVDILYLEAFPFISSRIKNDK